MAINYDKYIGSRGTHYIANSGSDERKQYHGGQAGDQTGHEAELRAWYSRPWTAVLRHPDPAVGLMIARLSVAMCLNDCVGYDQYQRTTYWQQLVKANYDPGAIRVKCEGDCTATTTANVRAAGHIMGIPKLENIPADTCSGNMRARFAAAGFRALTAGKYLAGPDHLLPGDVLLYEGHHAAVNVTRGKYAGGASKPSTTPERILKNGMSGADVQALQGDLIRLGYSCGSWGADGDFGDATEMAVRAFQRDHGCGVDGEFGPESRAAMAKALEKPEDGSRVRIVGGDCYVRGAPGTDGRKLDVALEGALLDYAGTTAENGWLAVRVGDGIGWVSGKYGRRTK